MTNPTHQLNKVFGVIRSVPETYVARESDKKLKSALYDGKHIVIRGDTKQGKTCLRKVVLPDEACIVATCQKEWSFADLNKNILRRAGAKTIEVTTDVGKQGKISPRFGGNLGIVKVDVAVDVGGNVNRKILQKEFEINFDDMGDVIEVLKASTDKKFIILDDFHTLTQTVQYSFASAVKAAFEDSDYTFVVVGVWRDDNRLVKLNGDLQGRVVDVPVAQWSRDELLEVIKKGEDLLKVRIDEDFKRKIVFACYGSVFIVQEACKRLCMRNDIYETQTFSNRIGNERAAEEILGEIAEEMTARYGTFIADFLKLGSHTADRVNVEDYISIINVLLLSPMDRLFNGINFSDILEFKRRSFSRKKDFERSLRSALIEIGHCQSAMQYNPVILGYDGGSARLEIVDRGFLFWLSRTDRRRLLNDHGYTKYSGSQTATQ